jgi:hypothetical protein
LLFICPISLKVRDGKLCPLLQSLYICYTPPSFLLYLIISDTFTMSNNNRSNQNNMAAERALTPSMASKTQISPVTADDSDRGTPVSAPAQRQGITPQALTTPPSSVVSHELVQASSDVQSGDAGNTVPDFKPTRYSPLMLDDPKPAD